MTMVVVGIVVGLILILLLVALYAFLRRRGLPQVTYKEQIMKPRKLFLRGWGILDLEPTLICD